MARKWLVPGGIATVIGVLITFWALQTDAEVEVTTLPVTVGPIARRVTASGTLQTVTTVDVGVQVSGIVQSLSADWRAA